MLCTLEIWSILSNITIKHSNRTIINIVVWIFNFTKPFSIDHYYSNIDLYRFQHGYYVIVMLFKTAH